MTRMNIYLYVLSITFLHKNPRLRHLHCNKSQRNIKTKLPFTIKDKGQFLKMNNQKVIRYRMLIWHQYILYSIELYLLGLSP